MRILGIDPGVATTGYGILEQSGDHLVLLDYGILTSWPKDPLGTRLLDIRKQLQSLLALWQLDHAAMERLFFNQNAQTAMAVGMACGVLLTTLAEASLPIFEYTPLQVKEALTGYGRATKQQIQAMVKSLLQLPSLPKPDDAADAVAIALCHAHSFPLRAQLEKAVQTAS